MKRILISPLAGLAPPDSRPATALISSGSGSHDREFAAGRGTVAEQHGDQCLFVPLHYESGHAYPLIVWLHGNGASPRQLLKVMPAISHRNYVAVAPKGGGRPGTAWRQTAVGIAEASRSITEAIDYARMRLHVAADRIYLAGAGAGGTMALRIALQMSHLFAGVLSFNGALPEGLSPFRNWVRCRGLPVFWTHHRDSLELGEDRLCGQLRLLHIAGFDVHLRQYPGDDDSAADAAFADANRWIMQQVPTAVC